jgi:hypothetical protein
MLPYVKDFTKNFFLDCTETNRRVGFRTSKIEDCELINDEMLVICVMLILKSLFITVLIYHCCLLTMAIVAKLFGWIFRIFNLSNEQNTQKQVTNLERLATFNLDTVLKPIRA